MSLEAPAWAGNAWALREELATNPGRLALLEGGDVAYEVAEEIALAWGTGTTPVGRLLTASEHPPGPQQIVDQLIDGSIFSDLEILFGPELQLSPVFLFRQLARSGPRVFLWPGEIDSKTARFSRPGRRDHYEAGISDTVILRARRRRFPDETPYEIERVP
jgi:hypothetical protein